MKWWLARPMRMVQTNLREIDADIQIDQFIAQLRAMSANVLLFNVGGIQANYPTDLEYHYRNPHLTSDLVGEVSRRAQAEGIRFIARFDFSKINEALAAAHPQWLYRGADGQTINYNGQVHTCINGWYQQQYSLDILAEVIDRYPIDGVFFNMIGYVEHDYSGKFHGNCQCDSCRQGYRAYVEGLSGQPPADDPPLPNKPDRSSPNYLRYLAFRETTIRKQFEKTHAFVTARNADIAIMTYASDGVDVVRHESNTGLDRPQPEWTYSATANVNSVLASWPGKAVANAAVHFIDFPYRHAAVSPHLTCLRLAENLANAAWLDFYVIGPLEKLDDRFGIDRVRAMFQFAADHERWYSDVAQTAPVCVIQPSGRHGGGDLRGTIQLLSELHILFNIVSEAAATAADALQGYDLVILPDSRILTDPLRGAIDAHVSRGGKLLCTGKTATQDDDGSCLGRVALRCAQVAQASTIPAQRGAYLRVRPQDKRVLQGFDDLDIAYLDGDLMDCSHGPARQLLGFIPPHMFGPPEKCYYKDETSIPGLLLSQFGDGSVVVIPWQIGRHYERMANHAHCLIFAAALRDLLGFRSNLITNAPPLVEFRSQTRRDGQWQLLSLVNHSGQNRAARHQPLPIYNIQITLRVSTPVSGIHALWAQQQLSWTHADQSITFTLPRLDLLETLVITTPH